ncbi:MAG: Lar family restriction alleviation protein [Burkholderiales bacterium]
MSGAVEGVALLPCPFCGGEELSHGFASGGGVYFGTVQCHADGCGAAFTMDSGEDEAVAAWNTRVGSSDAHLRERIAVLERENRNYAKTMEIIGQMPAPPVLTTPPARSYADEDVAQIIDPGAWMDHAEFTRKSAEEPGRERANEWLAAAEQSVAKSLAKAASQGGKA